ncbi:MAG: acyl-CoA dehydrogenase family protein [Thermodesulfobacteriota bacterium]
MDKNEEFIEKKTRDLARRIAQERIAPTAGERDRNGAFPREAIEALGDSGLLCLVVAENRGGVGAPRTALAWLASELGRACASTALVAVSHVIVEKAVETAAADLIRDKWLPRMMAGRALGAFAVHEPNSGSNVGAITTSARKTNDGYIVNGSKFFITSAGEADVYLVLTRTDPEKGPPGMSALLIEKETPGLSFGHPEDKMGLRSSSSREMFFDDCRVPAANLVGAEGGGLQIIGQNVIGWGFFGAAGISVGLAQAAVDLVVKHARERTIAGQPIGVHQAVQSLITDMIIQSEAAETLLASCAGKADAAPASANINGFKAKLFASESAVEVTNKAIQVMGGHGYCRDYTVERLFRDARGLMLHFKTSEWLRQDVAKAALGL